MGRAAGTPSPSRRGCGSALAVGLATLMGAGAARAQDEPGPTGSWTRPVEGRPAPAVETDPPQATPVTAEASADLGRLEDLLRLYEAKDRRRWLWTGLSMLAISGVTIPTGYVIARHVDEDSLVGPIAFGMGAGVLAIPVVAFFFSEDDFGRLLERLNEERAAGKPAAEVLASVESEWERLAAKRRSERRIVGIIALSLSPLVLGGAAYLALSDKSGLSNEARYNSSALLMSSGILGLGVGLGALFVEDRIEVAWDTYRMTARPPSPTVGFGVGPAPGGGTLQVTGSF